MSEILSAGMTAMPAESDVVSTEDMQFESYCYIEDIPTLDSYIWYLDKKTSSDKFYCRMDNIVLSSVWINDLKYFYHFQGDDTAKFFLLLGKLIPSIPTESPILVKLAVPTNGWFFYFSESPSSPSSVKGHFWVKDHEGTWYQVLHPHPVIYADKYQDVYSSIFHTFNHKSAPSSVNKPRVISIENAFICNRDWDWVELDPFVSTSLVGIFIHGDVVIVEDGEATNRKVCVRVPITDFIVNYYDIDKNGHPKIEYHSSIYDKWFQIVSVDESYRAANDNFMQRAALESLLRNQSQRSQKYPDPFFSAQLEILEDTATSQAIHKSLGYVEFPASSTSSSLSHVSDGAQQTGGIRARVKIAERNGTLQAYFRILDICVEVARGRAGHTLLLRAPGVYLRISHSKDSSTDTGPSVSHDEIQALVARYNWPAGEEAQIWRHITDFCCYQVDEVEASSGHKGSSSTSGGTSGGSKSRSTVATSAAFSTTLQEFQHRMVGALEFTEEKKFKAMVVGKLLPPPKCLVASSDAAKKKAGEASEKPLVPLTVFVHAKKYSIDYGMDKLDANRGLWIEGSTVDTWYKLIPPVYSPFASLANSDFTLTRELLTVSDIVQDKDNLNIIIDKASNRVIVPITVKEMYQRLEGRLNLEFLRNNAEFVLSNLDVIVNVDKSKEFKKSVYALKDEDFTHWLADKGESTATAAAASGSGSSGSSGSNKRPASVALATPLSSSSSSTSASTSAAASSVSQPSPAKKPAIAVDARPAVAATSSSRGPSAASAVATSASASTALASHPASASASAAAADKTTKSTAKSDKDAASAVDHTTGNNNNNSNNNNNNNNNNHKTAGVKRPIAELEAAGQRAAATAAAAVAGTSRGAPPSIEVPRSSSSSSETGSSAADAALSDSLLSQQPPRKIKKKERSAEELEQEEEIEEMERLARKKQLKDQEERELQQLQRDQGYFTCTYCRTTAKKAQCQNTQHEDGKLVAPRRNAFAPVDAAIGSHPLLLSSTKEQLQQQQQQQQQHKTAAVSLVTSPTSSPNTPKLDLCPFCKSLSKMPSCPLSIHNDGAQLKRKALYLDLGIDETHERRQYEKHHQSRLHLSGWSSSSSSPSPSSSSSSSSSAMNKGGNGNNTSGSSTPTAAIAAASVSVSSVSANKLSFLSRFNSSSSAAAAAASNDYQGRIVDVEHPTVHQPTVVSKSLGTALRSALKKVSSTYETAAVDEGNSSNSHSNSSSSDSSHLLDSSTTTNTTNTTNTTGSSDSDSSTTTTTATTATNAATNAATATTATNASTGSETRRQYLATLRQQRQTLRASSLTGGAHAHVNSNSSGNSSGSATVVWQDELPDSDRVLGHCYIIDRIDLSQIPRYSSSSTADEDRSADEEEVLYLSTF